MYFKRFCHIRLDLRQAGSVVWFDQHDIRSGTPFDTAIQQAIQAADLFMIILSPKSVSSSNVLDELTCALDEGKIIIPLLLTDCVIPLRLRRLQYIDFRSNYKAGLNMLVDELLVDRLDTLHRVTSPAKRPSLPSLLFAGLGLLMVVIAVILHSIYGQQKDSLTPLVKAKPATIPNSKSVGQSVKEKGSQSKQLPTYDDKVALSEGKSSNSPFKQPRNNRPIVRSWLIIKPIEADHSTPDIVSWTIVDNTSKKTYTVQTDSAVVRVDSDAELTFSCLIEDQQGVKKVALAGNIGWNCHPTESRLVVAIKWMNRSGIILEEIIKFIVK